MPMGFIARNTLILKLKEKGFKPGRVTFCGWQFNRDGVNVWFDSRGLFRITAPGHVMQNGVATEPEHILDLVNQ